MSRPWRLELAGGFYHMTSRGDRREDIYLHDRDRERGMVVAYQTGDYAMKAIASFFNVHYSTISRAIKKAGSENA